MNSDSGCESSPKFSVCIPAYDMAGKGAEFLSDALASLALQTFKDFEVVVSDQSQNLVCGPVCDEFRDRLSIKFVDYRKGPKQASANTNYAMSFAMGKFIKVLFQDDFFVDNEGLSVLSKTLDASGANWALTGSGVVNRSTRLSNPLVPRMHKQIRFGKNTVSSPSVLSFCRESSVRFDENLIWLMDVEMYHQCYLEFGEPVIVPDAIVANRLHDAQVSNSITPKIQRSEMIYVARKHGFSSRSDFLSLAHQLVKTIKL